MDHTSEVTMRLRAPGLPELFAEATRAFAELVPDALRGQPDEAWREFHLEAPDLAAVLVEWLNEVVYACEAEQWLPTEVEVTSERDAELHLRARGERLSAPFVLVKAATLHQAFVQKDSGGLKAEVTLDI